MSKILPIHIQFPLQDGATPLHWAATKGNADVVQLLLDKGANFDRPNKVCFCLSLFFFFFWREDMK